MSAFFDCALILIPGLAGLHGALIGDAVSRVHVPDTSWNPGVLVVAGPADKPEDGSVLQSTLHSLESLFILTPTNAGVQSAFAAVPSTIH